MKSIYLVLFLFGLASGCQKSNDAPRVEAAHQFGALGGSCYDYTSATYTAATNCPGLNTTSTYTMQNGTCMSSTGQPVAASFCSTNLPPSAGPCYGNYIYYGNGYPEYGYCYGSNCKGYSLTEAATGKTVTCQ